jgi:hypothetical protein
MHAANSCYKKGGAEASCQRIGWAASSRAESTVSESTIAEYLAACSDEDRNKLVTAIESCIKNPTPSLVTELAGVLGQAKLLEKVLVTTLPFPVKAALYSRVVKLREAMANQNFYAAAKQARLGIITLAVCVGE